MQRLIWYLKQLLPLKYDTVFGRDGKWFCSVWRMWFGRCFNVKEYALSDELCKSYDDLVAHDGVRC